MANSSFLSSPSEPLSGEDDACAVVSSVAVLRTMLDAVPHPILVKDRSQRWIWVNAAMCSFVGLPANALIGSTDAEWFSDEQARQCAALEQQAIACGRRVELEAPVSCGRGSFESAVMSAASISIDAEHGGAERFVVLTFTDTSRFTRAEAALRESQAHYRYTFELSPLYYWTATPDGAVNKPSRRWAGMMGVTAEQLFGDGWTALVHPEDLDRVTAAWQHSVGSGEPFDSEHRLQSPGGPCRWHRIRANPRRDAQGQIIRWYGTAEDVDDRKKAEEALRESEDHYRHAVELNPQFPFTVAPNGMLNDCSPRWCELVGMSAAETAGRGWMKSIHPDDLPAVLEAWNEALRVNGRVDYEMRVRLADGSYRWFRGRAAPRLDAQGRVLRWYGATEDIHDRRQVEMALRESEDHYRHTVELSPQFPFTFSAEGGLLEVSPQWLQRVGLRWADCKGSGWLQTIHPEDLPHARAMIAHALSTGEPCDFEQRMRMANGDYRWIRTRAYPRRDAEGRIVRWYGTSEDIHERKLMETALRESEEFSRSVHESSLDCIKVLSLDGHLLFMNSAGLKAMGDLQFSQVQGRHWSDFVDSRFRDPLQAAIDQASAGQNAVFAGYQLSLPDHPTWWSITLSPILGDAGTPVRILAISRDITAARAAADALEQARQETEEAARRLREVLESTTDAVVVLDRKWRLTYANRNAVMLRQQQSWTLGARLGDIFPEQLGGVFDRHFREAMREQKAVTFEGYLQSASMWLEVHVFPTVDGVSIFFRDIGERRRYEQERRATQERIEFMAKHDALTGLPNRLLFGERLESALGEVASQGSLAVHCLDLDGFKVVNDTLGHPAGDALLQQVAERLRECMRAGDTLARFGGDEFSIVQPGIRGRDDAAQLAQRVIQACGTPFEIDGRPVVIGTSIGIAMADAARSSVDELVKCADIALYRAKAEGRATFRFFEPEMEAHLLERQNLKLSLQGALARQEFELRFEPIIDVETGRVRSFEALIRWHMPNKGLVPPLSFIPAAEETGLILPIGEWVLRTACTAATQWPADVRVAVNLSPVQFKSANLVDIILQALGDSGLDPQRLELEITESVLLQNSDSNRAALHALRALGVRIVMDDFGTGYSSLSYLRSFPFDKIKIDRSFVRELPDGAESSAIIRSIVTLCRTLGISTTAEGVELQTQFEALQREDCSEVQGHLFGQPLQTHEVHAFLMKRRADKVTG